MMASPTIESGLCRNWRNSAPLPLPESKTTDRLALGRRPDKGGNRAFARSCPAHPWIEHAVGHIDQRY